MCFSILSHFILKCLILYDIEMLLKEYYKLFINSI
nr:MAG TPA: hypothetical protein [Caudoviricetes sp.]